MTDAFFGDPVDVEPISESVRTGPAARLLAERDRWGLWLPVGFGTGAAFYLAMPMEPWAGWSALALAVFAVVAWQAPWTLLRPVWVGLAMIAAGFLAAQGETWRAGTVMLDRLVPAVEVSGAVTDLDPRPEGLRVTLVPTRIAGLSGPLPPQIRIRLREPIPLAIGDVIRVRATLLPPPGPSIPGGFDFQRQAYFAGLGAVGYALGAPTVTAAEPNGVRAWIRAIRQTVAARIRDGLPGPRGAIVAAIVTGERGAIPPDLNEAYRNAGLAHLLVIAGLHMSLVTGFVFGAVRAVLALIPPLALRYPIKKWAAGGAWITAGLYLVLSGAAIPTQRAFVMISLGLCAILVDRLPFSLRGLAIAAMIVLLVDPVAVAGVSFEMSFAAVLALISFYESFGPKLAALGRNRGSVGRAGFHLLGVALTTVLATLGTAGFSIYHFNRFALYSVVANLVAVPLAAVWIMPWAVIACLLMPFGFESFALVPLGWGLDLIDAVARWSADLPGAVLELPTMPMVGLFAIIYGGLWLALWRGRWRRWGMVAMGLGLASMLATRPADILVAEDARLVALRVDGGYLLSSVRADRVSAETWLREAGGGHVEPWPGAGKISADGALRCDPIGCLWRHDDRLIAIDEDWGAFAEDCRRAAIVISPLSAPLWCRDRAIVIDRAFVRKNGATAIRFGTEDQLETVDSARGARPWVVRPGPWRALNSDGATPPDDPAP